MEVFTDEYFMAKALELALQAYDEEEVPIGALVVHENKIIGKGYNQTERLQDVTAHAEMLALTAASNAVNGKYLDQCTLYVTIEPCLMCAGAIQWARLAKVVWGAPEPKFGFSRLDAQLLGKTETVGGIMADQCGDVMKRFFKSRRK
ncbi:MAG: nucleoside deaminase [Sphingomonadales bacterium]|nr:nucleoside deaminase [Sphingomonadales bacterium]